MTDGSSHPFPRDYRSRTFRLPRWYVYVWRNGEGWLGVTVVPRDGSR